MKYAPVGYYRFKIRCFMREVKILPYSYILREFIGHDVKACKDRQFFFDKQLIKNLIIDPLETLSSMSFEF